MDVLPLHDWNYLSRTFRHESVLKRLGEIFNTARRAVTVAYFNSGNRGYGYLGVTKLYFLFLDALLDFCVSSDDCSCDCLARRTVMNKTCGSY